MVSFLTTTECSFRSISTELDLSDHVRSSPDSDRPADIDGGPVRANKRHRLGSGIPDFEGQQDVAGQTAPLSVA